jgi:23S rRNA (cytosine1962-C5)-methyltransferase
MNTYKLLDTGNLEKLEQVGPYRLIRPALNAYWKRSLPQKEWDLADGHYFRNNKGSGHWDWKNKLPESWNITYGNIDLISKPTDFGHLGFFPEQISNWNWLTDYLAPKKNISTLNMFAYSGGSTLAMAKSGNKVCHLDAAKGMVDWARENWQLNKNIPDCVRWITDDVNKFIQRELKRNAVYQGIVLDPPSFGRGSKGQVWKIEKHLLPLLHDCKKLMGEKPEFLILSMHSNGYSPISLERVLNSIFPKKGKITSGEMLINEESGKQLPAGIYAKWVTE